MSFHFGKLHQLTRVITRSSAEHGLQKPLPPTAHVNFPENRSPPPLSPLKLKGWPAHDTHQLRRNSARIHRFQPWRASPVLFHPAHSSGRISQCSDALSPSPSCNSINCHQTTHTCNLRPLMIHRPCLSALLTEPLHASFQARTKIPFVRTSTPRQFAQISSEPMTTSCA